MSSPEVTLDRLRQANPSPAGSEPPEDTWTVAVLLEEIDRRSESIDHLSAESRSDLRRLGAFEPEKRRLPRWVVALAAAVVVLFLVAGAAWVAGLGNRVGPADQSTIVSTTTDVIEPAPTTVPMPTTDAAPPLSENKKTLIHGVGLTSLITGATRAQIGDGAQSGINAVTVGGPGLVAVGSYEEDAAVWVSSDGSTWSRVPHDDSVLGGSREELMKDVIVGGPGFLAVGGHRSEAFFVHADERCDAEFPQFCDPGAPLADSGALVWTSADGLEWSRVFEETSPGGQQINAVTVGGPGFVAVGGHWSKQVFDLHPLCAPGDTQYCDAALADLAAAVWTSTDGVTWSRVADHSNVFAGEVIYDVVAGPPGLVAVGSAVWFSPDGVTWTVVYDEDDLVYDPGDNRAGMRAVTRGGSGFVAVGWGGAIWTSTDGIAWSRLLDVEPVFGFIHLSAVASNSSGFVAVAQDSFAGPSGAFISPDGVSWTQVPHDQTAVTTFDGEDRGIFGASRPEDVIFAEPGLVVVGRSWQDETGAEAESQPAAVWVMTHRPGVNG